MITVLYDQIFHQFYYLQFIIIRVYILILRNLKLLIITIL